MPRSSLQALLRSSGLLPTKPDCLQVPISGPRSPVETNNGLTDFELVMNMFSDGVPSIEGMGDIWSDVATFAATLLNCTFKFSSLEFAFNT